MINILIADDNDSNIYVLEMLIEEWFDENNIQGYNIDSVLNGLESVQKFENNKYDLIFLDIMMPIMDGFEALEKIRNMKIQKQPPVIVASAIIDDNINKDKAKRLKANAFIVKPLSYDTINIMLNKYLKDTNNIEEKEIKDDSKYIYFDDNESKKINSTNFLDDYPDDIIDYEDFEELQHFSTNFNINLNSTTHLNDYIIEEFKQIVEKSRIMLLGITEFEDFNITLNKISNFSKEIIHAKEANSSLIFAQLTKITENILTWFEEVFIEKTSQNVLEIDNIISNDFIKLKNIVLQK